MATRFILRFAGPSASAEEIARVRQRYHVVDESPRMMLVEAADGDSLAREFPKWKVSPEVQYRIPEPKIRVRSGVK